MLASTILLKWKGVMEIKIKIFFILSIVIIVLIFVSFVWIKKNRELVTINSSPAPYEFHFRIISSGYFSKIKKGTTIDELKKKIGEPNGTVGFGAVIPYYETIDGKYVLVMHAYTEPQEITLVRIVDKRGDFVEKTITISE